MALVYFDDDPWITAHDACEKLYRDVQAQLVTWSAQSRSSGLYAPLAAEIRLRLRQYQAEIGQLRQQLDRTTGEQMITDAESERRLRQIEMLQSRLVQLQSQFNNGVQTSVARSEAYKLDQNKQELFGSSSSNQRPQKDSGFREVKSVNWGAESDDEEMIDSGGREMPIQQIKKTQREIIEDQDRGLDELSKIISRQRNIAENIGNEVALHNEIIDDIADHVDRADGRIQTETDQVRLVDLKDTTCRYWTIIIMLFIAIVIISLF